IVLFCSIQPFTANFTRVSIKRDTEEIVKGTMYYIAPLCTYYEINEPIHQMISVVKNITTIYYPEEKKAFRIISTNPSVSLFNQPFITDDKNNDYLKKMGLKQKNIEYKSDTVFIYYVPLNEKNSINKFVTGKVGNKVVYSEMTMKDESGTKIYLKKHIKLNDIEIPTEIIYKRWSDLQCIEERTSYNNISPCPAISDSLNKFRVPKGIKIKEIKW
ncbi:MAG: hypothetical protein ABIJ94_02830, partial [candidate division WOR-3 bacterium]